MLNFQGYVESDNDLQHVSAGTFDTVGFWIGGQLCRKIWLHISKLVCNCTAVATKIWMAPCNNWSTRHYSSKCPPSCLNPLHTFELVLDFRAVTTYIWIAPDHNRPIQKDCSECRVSCLKILDTFELVLDFRAVTTYIWIAPDHNRPIQKDCSECRVSCLKILDTFELVLDFRAVTTSIWIAPDHNRPIRQDRVCSPSCLNLLDVAATFASMAIAVRWAPSSSPAACKDFVGSTTLWSAATSLKKPSWNDFCARTLKSPTLEDCAIEKISLRPLGTATVTWSMYGKISCTNLSNNCSWAKLHHLLSAWINSQD